MSAPRLTFLYPFLFAPARQTPSRTARSAFTAGARNRHSNNTVQQRYGTANEPLPHLGPARTGPRTASRKGGKGKEVKDASSLVQTESRQTKDTEAEKEQATATGPTSTRTTPTTTTTTTTTDASKSAGANDAEKMASVPTAQAETQAQPLRLPLSSILDSSESQLAEKPRSTPPLYDNALQTVLNMPPPDSTAKDTVASPLTPDRKSDETAAPKQQQRPAQDQQENRPYGAAPKDENRPLEHQKPPHISTPPYVHHFDTYSLVRRLEEGGWTQAQSITLMKAVRTTLSSNMNLAHQGLVSKSDVENEAYLFSAACSELHTEISTKRKAEAERSRTDRTQLTHEVDILSQRMTQESGNMKDELKGMFDDRKMAVRNEQRDMERKLQELNYRITVTLDSDSRSDVEGVRWIITKRAIGALAICVAMILGSLKFASSVAQWEEEERKMLAAAREKNSGNNSGGGGNGSGHNSGGNGGNSGRFDQGNNSPRAVMDRDRDSGSLRGDELGHGEILVQQGDNPAFVSLG